MSSMAVQVGWVAALVVSLVLHCSFVVHITCHGLLSCPFYFCACSISFPFARARNSSEWGSLALSVGFHTKKTHIPLRPSYWMSHYGVLCTFLGSRGIVVSHWFALAVYFYAHMGVFRCRGNMCRGGLGFRALVLFGGASLPTATSLVVFSLTSRTSLRLSVFRSNINNV